MKLVCPLCTGELSPREQAYECPRCAREYPVVCGIPDFRLWPDPFIGIEEDRRKGALLAEAGRSRGFREMLDYYYSITPENPPDLAGRWKDHAIAAVDLARAVLAEASLVNGSALLDLGCSTGGLLIAASGGWTSLAGVDVAFRWLVIASIRLREAGVQARLVCANAEALPFPPAAFDTVAAIDLLEHLRDPPSAARQARRVLVPGGRALWESNNRYAAAPEPHVRLWGVGYLPRRWQGRYVGWRRNDPHPYRIRLPGPREMDRLLEEAGFRNCRTEAAGLFAPHSKHRGLHMALSGYNRVRRVPVIRELATWFGPRLSARADG